MAIVINGSGTVTGLSVGGLPDGTVDEGTLASDSVTAAKIPDTVEAGFKSGRKNLIINGGMDVWQRGTSFSHSNGKGYCPDRFWLNPQSNPSTYSRQAVTSPIAGMASQYCLRMKRNAGETSTGLTYFSTDLESSYAYACRGRKLTLSFYARKGANYSATSDIFQLGIVTGKGTNQTLVSGYTSGAYVANQNNTLTSSWQRFTVTTGSVIPDDITQIGLQGTRTSVGTAGADDFLEITGIQLEIGDVATDFEYRSYGEELALCQRYYYKTEGTTGYLLGRGNGTSNLAGVHIPTLATMRTTPTFAMVSGTWYVIDSDSYVNGTSLGVSSIVLGGGHLKVQFSSLNSLTDNRFGMIQLPGYAVDAEL